MSKKNRLLHKAIKCFDANRLDQASQLCRKILTDAPDDIPTLELFGTVCYMQQRFDEAEQSFTKVLPASPRRREARRFLFNIYRETRRYGQMMEVAQQIERLDPEPIDIILVYSAYLTVCNWNRAKALQDQVLALLESEKIDQDRMSGFFLDLNAITDVDPKQIYRIHKRWGDHNIQLCRSARLPLKPAPLPKDRIKIGYLSTDFRQHAVGHLISPILRRHDSDHFEVYCYAYLQHRDKLTDLVRDNVEHFVDITQMTHAEMALRINQDGIHILVDLGGHTLLSQLPLMGFKPAPIQIAYLGYPNTTGMETVDFRITDRYADVRDGTIYTEELLIMPESFLAMERLPNIRRSEQTPAEKNGYITFGSFNHVRKLNADVVCAWSRILQAVPNSRMLIKSPGCETDIVKHNILLEFNRNGITSDRVEFAEYTHSYEEHAVQYNRVDIALDPFPYHGTHTTCECLWMGVPLITLEGKLHAQRVSSSILRNIGYDVTIATTVDEYVQKAVELAAHPENLSVVRQCIHTLFSHSIICNPEKVTKQLEDLYLEACRRKEIPIPASIQPNFTTTTLTLPSDVAIVVPETLDNRTTYVLTEQGDWYEDEIRFLRQIVEPGMRVVDRQAGYGCYALSMAKCAGDSGAVLAVCATREAANCIQQSAEANRFHWLSATIEPEQAMLFAQDGLDLLIVGEPEELSSTLLAQLDGSAPLIMLHSTAALDDIDTLITQMRSQSFAAFRFIPGLNLLAPYADSFAPEKTARPIFFCRQERSDLLAKAGYLARQIAPSLNLPDDPDYWQRAIEPCGFAAELLGLWKEQAAAGQTSDDWESVRNALAAYAMAHDASNKPDERFGFLCAAFSLLLNTTELQSSLPRLCTTARIASELGNPEAAMQALEMIQEGITTTQRFVPAEPFLPVAGIYDQTAFGDSIAEWILAQSMAQQVRLSHPTSHGCDGDGLARVNGQLAQLGFPDPRLCASAALLRRAAGASDAPDVSPVRATQQVSDVMVFDALSPEHWRMLRSYYADDASSSKRLLLAVPRSDVQEKIVHYLSTMNHFDANSGCAVSLVADKGKSSEGFLRSIIQGGVTLHTTKRRRTDLQETATKIASEVHAKIVWHDEDPAYMPKPLPPVTDFGVTIILTTYNRVALLKRAVDSILKQTYDDFILVICDDASTDGTEQYCTELVKRNPKVRYRRNKENLGPGKNAIDQGEWLETELVMGMSDDDFLLDPTAVEKMVDAFRKRPHIGIAFGQCHIGDVHTEDARTSIPANLTDDCIIDPEQMLLDGIAGNNMYGSGYIYRQLTSLHQYEYISEQWGKSNIATEGDYVMGVLQCMCVPIAYVDVPSVYYSLWEETISSSQLGGGWGMGIRLRAVAYIDAIYTSQFGITTALDRRIQHMADVFEQQQAKIEHDLPARELMRHKEELDQYRGIITCLRKHEFPDVLRNTSLL